MKVRFLISVAARNAVFREGRVYDLPPAEAEQYVSKGRAEFVIEEVKPPKQRPLTVQQVKNTTKRPVKR